MTKTIYLKRDRIFLSCFIFAIFSFVGCEKQPTLTFGQDQIADNNGANIVVIDTPTVKMATVVNDSTATSGTGFLQLGTYKDAYFGTVSSRAFIQLGLPNVSKISVFDSYDSIGIVMHYKKGNPYYGDTTSYQHITVNQVSELYQLNDFQNGFYSNSSLETDPTVLGSTDVAIGPNVPFTSQQIGDTIKIRLADQLGQQLFNMIYNNSDTTRTLATWLAYFHGLCLTATNASPNSPGAIYGYKDSILMRIYYHKAGIVSPGAYIDFGITNKGFQFNNVSYDRRNTELANLDTIPASQKPSMPAPPATPSDSVGHRAYVQTATGLNVKVTFPYLSNIASLPDYISVLRATLTVYPDPGSFGTTFTIPPQIGIYTTDVNNRIGAPLPGASISSLQTGNMVPNYNNPLSMTYTYDVTNFIKAQILNTSIGYQYNGLMLTVPATNNVNSYSRAVLNDFSAPVNQRVTLKVYYISLYPHN